MRLSSIVVISVVGLLAIVSCGFLIARKYGASVELTRNAAANARSRETQARNVLQQLAAAPKLTVGSRTVSGAQRGEKPRVLAVVSRHVLPLLVPTREPGRPVDHPLLERLENVDVESVSYDRRELPALLAELTNVRTGNSSSALDGDLKALIESLEEGGDEEASQIVFY